MASSYDEHVFTPRQSKRHLFKKSCPPAYCKIATLGVASLSPRIAPHDSAKLVADSIRFGEILYVAERQGEWVKVMSKISGWVPASSIYEVNEKRFGFSIT